MKHVEEFEINEKVLYKKYDKYKKYLTEYLSKNINMPFNIIFNHDEYYQSLRTADIILQYDVLESIEIKKLSEYFEGFHWRIAHDKFYIRFEVKTVTDDFFDKIDLEISSKKYNI